MLSITVISKSSEFSLNRLQQKPTYIDSFNGHVKEGTVVFYSNSLQRDGCCRGTRLKRSADLLDVML